MSENNPTGYYGKLPLRGDFIQRNLESEFIQTWDKWLQTVITNSREVLGDQWLNSYLVSPIWRFYYPLGSEQNYCGIVVPSVDKVGRYFPFTIVKNTHENIYSPNFISNNQDWFDEVEQLALQALEEKISFEQFNISIDQLNETRPNHQLEPTLPTCGFRIPLSKNMNLSMGFSQLSQMLPHPPSTQYSFWWTIGTEHIEGNLLCFDNMPDDNVYTAMLDGEWSLCHIQTL